jgi:hypothetical protein
VRRDVAAALTLRLKLQRLPSFSIFIEDVYNYSDYNHSIWSAVQVALNGCDGLTVLGRGKRAIGAAEVERRSESKDEGLLPSWNCRRG